MKVRSSSVVVACLALFALAAPVRAAAVPVQVNLTNLRAIGTYALDVKADDKAYLVVNGVAKGQDVNARVPKEGTLAAAPKKQPVSEKEPAELWKGELDNGEFALLTVTLFHAPEGEATADAAATTKFLEDLAAAGKGVAARAKKTLTADEVKALAAETLKAHQGVVTKATDKKAGTLGRSKNTDHFGGQFTLIVFNDNGKIAKRLDPIGLTFGEHYGTDVKAYTKLKLTRNNVLVQDEGGAFFPQQFTPVSDDKKTIRVKMLETEFEKNPKGKLQRNVTDYLADVQVLAEGKPTDWTLGGENPSDVGPLHPYWDFAE